MDSRSNLWWLSRKPLFLSSRWRKTSACWAIRISPIWLLQVSSKFWQAEILDSKSAKIRCPFSTRRTKISRLSFLWQSVTRSILMNLTWQLVKANMKKIQQTVLKSLKRSSLSPRKCRPNYKTPSTRRSNKAPQKLTKSSEAIPLRCWTLFHRNSRWTNNEIGSLRINNQPPSWKALKTKWTT